MWAVWLGVDGGGGGGRRRTGEEAWLGDCGGGGGDGDDDIAGCECIELFDGEDVAARTAACESKASSGDCFDDIALRRRRRSGGSCGISWYEYGWLFVRRRVRGADGVATGLGAPRGRRVRVGGFLSPGEFASCLSVSLSSSPVLPVVSSSLLAARPCDPESTVSLALVLRVDFLRAGRRCGVGPSSWTLAAEALSVTMRLGLLASSFAFASKVKVCRSSCLLFVV